MAGTPLLGPSETLLPVGDSEDVAAALAAGEAPAAVAARHPASSFAWAELAERALRAAGVGGAGEASASGAPLGDEAAASAVQAYAFARTGYHRGLDALRRAGWKGAGPVPWHHEPNRGFLRCLRALALAADLIGESDEAQRCTEFLSSSDSAVPMTLG